MTNPDLTWNKEPDMATTKQNSGEAAGGVTTTADFKDTAGIENDPAVPTAHVPEKADEPEEGVTLTAVTGTRVTVDRETADRLRRTNQFK